MNIYRLGRTIRSAVAWCVSASLVFPVLPAHAGPMDMGGQFAVNESGAATYTIPIQVPPGTGGMEPKLALSYNSQSGNGLLGVGWNLSGLSAITRCPRTMAQDGVRGGVNFDANDRFCMDGQRLMVVNGTYGADGAEYRTERESFSKIVSYGTAGSGPAWFKVWTKAGQILEYGNTTDSRIEAVKAAGATASWPTGTVRAWALDKVSDTVGNYMTYSYTEDSANGDFTPAQIDYTGNANTGLMPNASIQFSYEVRPDVVPKYQVGSIGISKQRLSAIALSQGGARITVYGLRYAASSASGRSLLNYLEKCVDAPSRICFPAKNVSYLTEAHAFAQAQGGQLSTGGFGTYDAYTKMLGDVNGDGIADLVVAYTGGSGIWAYTALGKGDGTFSQAQGGQLSTGGFGTYDAYTKMLSDVNGDGIADLVVAYTGGSGIWTYTALGKGDGTFSQAQGGQLSTGSFGTYDAYTKMLSDVNGDGIADLVVAYTGDSGIWAYTAQGKGDGTFSPAQGGQLSTGGFGAYDAYTKMLGDVNGDGIADLVVAYTGGSGIWAYTAQGKGDGTFSQAQGGQLSTGNFGTYDAYTKMLGDVNGDGIADLVVAYTGGSGIWAYTSPTSGVSSDQLAAIDEGIGKTITLSLLPATKTIYQKGSGSKYPLIDLQAPFYVASSVTSSNGSGGRLTTNYTYGGLRAELGTGRGLLGFAWQQATSPDTGVSVRTDYRQDWPYVGLPSKITKTQSSAAGPNKQLSVVTQTYACQNPASGSPCTVAAGNRYFPYLSQSVESNWDLNGTALPTATTTNSYDSYGNATQVSVSTSDGYSKTTTSTYTNDSTNWYLGRLTRSQVKSTTP